MYKNKDVLTIKHEELKALQEELAEFSLFPRVVERNSNECTVLVCERKKPQPWQIATLEIRKKKALLEKYKEDVEQVDLFGMERADYEEKKRICAEIIVELRELEKIVRENHPKYKKIKEINYGV